jgi:catechol 2,3-dioxygenase-like lactoylglutathione lyase family enzyme
MAPTGKSILSKRWGLGSRLFARARTGLFCLAFSTAGLAQDFQFQVDHFALVVEDLQQVGDFYGGVLGLEEIPHPSEPTGFRWFRIQGDTQLHLIGKERVAKEDNKSEHLCLSVNDLDRFMAFLNEKGVPFWDWPGQEGAVTLRADGVRQIYLRDPENNWIEINTASYEGAGKN